MWDELQVIPPLFLPSINDAVIEYQQWASFKCSMCYMPTQIYNYRILIDLRRAIQNSLDDSLSHWQSHFSQRIEGFIKEFKVTEIYI